MEAVVAATADVSGPVVAADPVMFGHSMLGTLVLAAAATVPCRGVIAVAPLPQLPPSRDVAVAYWEANAEPARREMAQGLTAKREATTDEKERAELQERFEHLRRWYDLDFDPAQLDALAVPAMGWVSSVLDSGASISWPGLLKGLTVPVLLALGEYDFVAPMAAWTDDSMPANATVEVFHRSGHTPFLEEPAEFVTATRRWAQHLS